MGRMLVLCNLRMFRKDSQHKKRTAARISQNSSQLERQHKPTPNMAAYSPTLREVQGLCIKGCLLKPSYPQPPRSNPKRGPYNPLTSDVKINAQGPEMACLWELLDSLRFRV